MQFIMDYHLEIHRKQNGWYQNISTQYLKFWADKWVGVVIKHVHDVMIAASISIELLYYQIILWSRQQDVMQLNNLLCEVYLCKLQNLLNLVV